MWLRCGGNTSSFPHLVSSSALPRPPLSNTPPLPPPPSYLGRITSFMYWMRYVWWILAMTAASVIGTTSLNWTWGGR